MSDAFSDCYKNNVIENRSKFEPLLLQFFRRRDKKNKEAIINLCMSIDVGSIQTRIDAFLLFADKVKRGRKKVYRNQKVFKTALNAFLNPEPILRDEGIFGDIVLYWNNKSALLIRCLEKLKTNIIYPGLSSEMFTKIKRDDHVNLAGAIGMFLGKSKNPNEFINIVSKRNLLMEK